MESWIKEGKFQVGSGCILDCDMTVGALMLFVYIPEPPLPERKYQYPLYYDFEVENGDISDWPKRVEKAFDWMRGHKRPTQADLPFTLKELTEALEFIEDCE